MSSPHLSRRDARFVWVLSALQLITWGSVFYTFALLALQKQKELASMEEKAVDRKSVV